MRRVFKTRHFARWMRKTELTNPALCKAVAETDESLMDADLGGGVLKKHVGLQALASDLLVRTSHQLDEAIAEGALLEICHDYKN